MQVVRAYTRVSTDEQAQEGFSIAAQRDAVQKFCESQSWVVADWYVEEGRSAKDLDRSQLTRLRADLRPGEVVVVYRLDRLTRSVLDLHQLLQEFEDQKAMFRSVTEPYDTTTAMGKLFITLVGAIAQWERENLGERVKFAQTQMVYQGKWAGGRRPFGYQHDQVAGRFVPDPVEAPVARQIFRWYAEGKGTRAIAIELNHMGIRTSQNARWTPRTIYQMLRNRAYLGHTVWNKRGKGDPVTVEHTHEPIVPADLFAAVHEILARHEGMHPRTIASAYPLSGIARCGVCGGRISGSSQPRYDKKTKEARWYARNYLCIEQSTRRGCAMKKVSARKVEASLLDQVRQLTMVGRLEREVMEQAAADPHVEERRLLEAELQTIAPRIKRWWDDYDAGDIPAKIANERTAALEARAVEVKERLSAISPAGARLSIARAAEMLQALASFWDDTPVEEQKSMLSELLESVKVYPGGEVAIKLKPMCQ